MRKYAIALIAFLLAPVAYASAPNVQQYIDQAWDAAQAQFDAALAAKDAEKQAMQEQDAAALAAAQSATAAANQQLADFKAYVIGKLGPLWDVAWEKQAYRGYDLDYTGFVETFRSDFDDLSQITPSTGNGPWFSGGAGVHTYFGNAYFDDCIVQNPQLCAIDNGALRLRMMTPDGNVATSWRSTILQTMRDDGTGWSQAQAPGTTSLFEASMKMPPAPASGFWGAFWLLAAGDYHPEITDNLIEIDLNENYGGQPTATTVGKVDPGVHTTVHVKPRRVPQPGDYPTRVSVALYSDPQTVFNTDPATGLATTTHTFPSNVAVFDGQFHLYSLTIDDNWVTMYFDRKSIGRVANKNRYFSTPLYMLLNQTLKRPSTNNGLTTSVDMWTDYVRAAVK